MDNINKMCRACLTIKETFSYFLFDNVTAEDYCFCTSVEVQENVNFPKSLCNSCYDLILKYSEFKKTCIESQNTLHKLKYQLTNESGETNFIQTDGDLLNDQKNNTEDEIYGGVKLEDDSDQVADDFYPIVEKSQDIILDNEIRPNKRKRKTLKTVRGHKRKEVKLKLPRKHFLYSCELCRKKFNYRERFEAHKLEHEGKMTSIVCLPCNKTFMTWGGLRRHNDNEHTKINLEKLKCKICGKLSKNRQTLRSHEKNHNVRSLSVCDVCGKAFTTPAALKMHLETHKENRERTFTCEQCGQKFYTQSILFSHVSRRHTGRKFICQICSFPFTDKYNLARHLLKHEGKKLYKCDVCDKPYATHTGLVEHKRMHSGERPFGCSYCNKCFVSKKILNEHIRTHTGERPFKCSVCEQGFSQSGTLRRHLKIHDRMVTAMN